MSPLCASEDHRKKAPVARGGGSSQPLGSIVDAATGGIARQCDRGELRSFHVWLRGITDLNPYEVCAWLRKRERELGREDVLMRLEQIRREGPTKDRSLYEETDDQDSKRP